MRTINSIQELRAERVRLRLQKNVLEEEIKNNIIDIKSDVKSFLQPINAMKRGAGKMLVNDQHGLLSDSIGGIVNLIGRKVIFRNSGMVMRLLVPFLMKNLTSNLVNENKDKILGWVFNFFGSRGKHHHNGNGHHKDAIYDKGTAHTDY